MSTALNCKEDSRRKNLYVGYSPKQWNAKLCVKARDRGRTYWTRKGPEKRENAADF